MKSFVGVLDASVEHMEARTLGILMSCPTSKEAECTRAVSVAVAALGASESQSPSTLHYLTSEGRACLDRALFRNRRCKYC